MKTDGSGNSCLIRPARAGDEPGAYYVCLKTGDFGKDGEPFYREDPDALGRIFAVTNMLRQAVFTVTTVVMGILDKFVGRNFHTSWGLEWEHAVFLVVGGMVLVYSGLAELGRPKSRGEVRKG